MPDGPITSAQSKAIHAARRSLGLDDAEYRLMLSQHRIKACSAAPAKAGWPVSSSKELSRSQARDILTRCQLECAAVGGPYSGHLPPAGTAAVYLATPAQRAQIERLVEEIAWRTPDGYDRWRIANLHIDRIRTYAEASSVIDGLRGLKAHGNAISG